MSDDFGIAIRLQDGCGLLQECGTAGSGYVSCCPDKTTCVKEDDNIYCCAEDDDTCAEDLNDEPRCADTEWGLYNNHYWDGTPGYFCCKSGDRGYNQTSEFSNGCAESDTALEDDEDWLPLVDQTIPSGTGFVTTTGTPPTATADPDNSDSGSGSGSVNTGAIAGGVVGGVAGLALIGAAAWWFLRKRNRGAAVPLEDGAAAGAKGEMDAMPALKNPGGPPPELEVREAPRELDAEPGRNHPPSELPA